MERNESATYTGIEQSVHGEQNIELNAASETNPQGEAAAEVTKVHKATLATQKETITFGMEGCKFLSQYAKLLIPYGAVENNTEIEIEPSYECPFDLGDGMLISPVIKFQSAKEVKFLKNVHIELYTPYSSAEPGRPINVEILRKEDGVSKLESIDMAKVDQEPWVSFSTKQMSSVFAVVPWSDLPYTKKRYYTAAIARDTEQRNRKIISWMVCDDMPNMREINKEYFEAQDHKKLIDPQSFEVKYEYGLRLELQETQDYHSPPIQITDHEAAIELRQRYGVGFDDKSQMRLQISAKKKFTLRLNYQVDAITSRQGGMIKEASQGGMIARNIFNKPCYLSWDNSHTCNLI